MSFRIPVFALFTLLWQIGIPALGAATADSYLDQIKPILRERCYACHGALKQKGGLRLDTAERIHQGGKEGSALDLPHPELSRLLTRITHLDPEERMPPEAEALKPAEIAAIRAWIVAGAPRPATEREDDDPRDHWAFQRIERPPLPAGTVGENPIDAFLAQKREEHHLVTQSQEAERSLLLRRLYLDLIGLPPTTAQQADPRPWETIVEELLTSPQHGERWGRHWMDVWRYSDWYGLGAQLRYSQKHLWHWRDWIVESLDADKGYDRMIQEMLAADEIAPTDSANLRATGFLARNYYLFNRTTWLDSTIEHTGKAFLGLTMNCAKCHDHKYDPIEQVDYYRFRAIFEPHQVRLDPVAGITDFEKDGLPRVFDRHLDTETFLHVRGDPAHPDTSKPLTPGVPKFLASFAPEIKPVSLPIESWAPGSREYVRQDRRNEAQKQIEAAKREVAEARGKGASAPKNPPVGSTKETTIASEELAELRLRFAESTQVSLEATIAADDAAFSRAADALGLAKIAALKQAETGKAKATLEVALKEKAGDAGKLQAAKTALVAAEKALTEVTSSYQPLRASKAALEGPAEKEEDTPVVFPETSSGRRTMLAQWITSRDNPLTARVAVNHVWLRHFGEPLVETVFDFGRQAPRPEHQDLLDWLAVEFIESGWSFRHLHRLMVTSETYRLTSTAAGADHATLAADPTNRFYWRMNPRRMESQVVRDSLLELSGTLDTTRGGPSIQPSKPSTRRSLYFIHSGGQQDKFLTMFDDADLLQCYRRSESIVPQQALALSNSALSLEQAAKIAGHLAGTTDENEFIAAAFAIILARAPDESERTECRLFLGDLRALAPPGKAKTSDSRERAQLIHALLNHNDFVTIR